MRAKSSLEGIVSWIIFYHLGSINWGKMTGLSMSALNVALFHLLEWIVSSVWEVQQKAKVETYAFVNFMPACFGTTKSDFSELEWGNGLLLEMSNKTSGKKRLRRLDFWIIRVLYGNNQLLQWESKSGEMKQTVKQAPIPFSLLQNPWSKTIVSSRNLLNRQYSFNLTAVSVFFWFF